MKHQNIEKMFRLVDLSPRPLGEDLEMDHREERQVTSLIVGRLSSPRRSTRASRCDSLRWKEEAVGTFQSPAFYTLSFPLSIFFHRSDSHLAFSPMEPFTPAGSTKTFPFGLLTQNYTLKKLDGNFEQLLAIDPSRSCRQQHV